MRAGSLRMRLLAGAAVAILAALTAAWFAMTLLFERHIENRLQDELTRTALQIAANLVVSANGDPSLEQEPADPRFAEPASGLYWQVSTSSSAQRSRSLWDQVLPRARASANAWKLRKAPGPFESNLLILERELRPERSAPRVLVQIGHDQSSLTDARDEFGRELAAFLALLWLFLSAGAWLQVQLGLRPLRRVGRELEAMTVHADQRLDASHVSEVQPLTNAINALADAREQDLAWARRRAADLAHGLKTPLAALAAQSRRARDAGAIQAADGLDRAIASATTAVETALARSRAATIRRSPPGTETALMPVVESVIGVIERTDHGARVVFDVEIASGVRVPMQASDLTEMLGALIENAARHARRQVRIAGAQDAAASLTIEDDGPGIGPERVDEAMMRGGRLDESGEGHGLGLPIARELIEATGGEISLSRAALGGLRVRVLWPAEPASSSPM